tara:strand:- start:5878 stop:6168 length:291 start_codon:yes stop_codon:yes gene_type:complete
MWKRKKKKHDKDYEIKSIQNLLYGIVFILVIIFFMLSNIREEHKILEDNGKLIFDELKNSPPISFAPIINIEILNNTASVEIKEGKEPNFPLDFFI